MLGRWGVALSNVVGRRQQAAGNNAPHICRMLGDLSFSGKVEYFFISILSKLDANILLFLQITKHNAPFSLIRFADAIVEKAFSVFYSSSGLMKPFSG